MFIIKDWKKDVFTIPNILSVFRLLLIPVYLGLYLKAGDDLDMHLFAAGVLGLSCLTDAVDGQIARRFNMISTLGKILDPLADKATQFSLILCLEDRVDNHMSCLSIRNLRDCQCVLVDLLDLCTHFDYSASLALHVF